MEEGDGYLIGETDPFSSEEAMVVCPVEDRDGRDVLPPLDESVESTEVFKEDRLDMLLPEEVLGPPASVTTVGPRGVLKGRLEVYMLYDVFGDVGAVIVTDDFSGIQPFGIE